MGFEEKDRGYQVVSALWATVQYWKTVADAARSYRGRPNIEYGVHIGANLQSTPFSMN